MPLPILMNLISAINGITSEAKSLRDVQKRSALQTKAAEIENLSLTAREWAISLNDECDQLQARVKELEEELEKKGTPPC